MIDLDFFGKLPKGPAGPVSFPVIAVLNCCRQTMPGTSLTISLANVQDDANVFCRVDCKSLLSMKISRVSSRKIAYIKQEYSTHHSERMFPVSISTRSLQYKMPLSDRLLQGRMYWKDDRNGPKQYWSFSATTRCRSATAILICRDFEVPFILVIGIFHECSPLIDI